MEDNDLKHYIKICVSRELTNLEFEEMTDIIEDEIGDIVVSDDVLEFQNNAALFCYVFQLGADVVDCEQGPSAEDLISYEMEQLLPAKLKWDLEVSKNE
jgi:hypothetical protein